MGFFDKILGTSQYKVESLVTSIYKDLMQWDNMRSTVGIRNMRGMDSLSASLKLRFDELWSLYSQDMGKFVSSSITIDSRRVPLTNMVMLIIDCAQDFEKTCKTSVLSQDWKKFYSLVTSNMPGAKEEEEEWDEDEDEDEEYEEEEEDEDEEDEDEGGKYNFRRDY
ncbi:hypothetical protein [Rufibacter sp. LB8]|uniref:hypothetical protein n=1 Tax=Rufibacter sp. LB8 TaxID=2777781 RepID=UPI00178C6FCC|nr:hypothetical protein [Rufibacter sp. LB8]